MYENKTKYKNSYIMSVILTFEIYATEVLKHIIGY